MGKKQTAHTIHWPKETFLLILAVVSLLLLIYEEIAKPTGALLDAIDTFDLIVAFIFLIDFFWLLRKSRDRKYFFRHNWYLLLASIPIYSGWAEALRGLRILRFVKLIRVGEHLDYSIKHTKH